MVLQFHFCKMNEPMRLAFPEIREGGNRRLTDEYASFRPYFEYFDLLCRKNILNKSNHI